MADALEGARESEDQAALLVIDLDDFKPINDTLGHHAGDEVLRQVAMRLLACVSPSDTVARTGGDEFSIVLVDPTGRDVATNVAESIKRSLGNPLRIGGQDLMIGASVGIAIYPADAANADSLCIAADSRMYESKRRERGRQRHD